MPRRALPLLLAAGALLAGAAPAPAAGLGLRTCPDERDFLCGTLAVPLDRTGAMPGTLRLRVAAERRSRSDRGVLIVLSGGPGQGSVAAVSAIASVLAPAARRMRLVVLDQRGTGGSGVLRCPGLQALRGLDPIAPAAVESCANRLGPSRVRYATADTVADLDDLRAALRAGSVSLMGVSYGTFVALQYARVHPHRVERLILDSVIGPDGIHPYLLDTYASLGRVLREQCGGARCAGITSDPVRDAAAVAARLTQGPLRGTVRDRRGRRRAASLRDPAELALLLVAADLNPFLQAALPGALAAARAGDPVPLLRLRRIGQGAGSSERELSAGLNVATLCADVRLPYSLAAPFEERDRAFEAALAQIPDDAIAPMTRAALAPTAIADDCRRWPVGDAPQPPSQAALPDVPALLLNGRLDLRTPLEGAQRIAALLPRARLVAVSGSGHDVLGGDVTGCVARALARFVAGAAVGDPCRGRTNLVSPVPAPPRSLRAVAAVRGGGGGDRGRVVAAALVAVEDARLSAGQAAYAGFRELAGGGLRGGRFASSGDGRRLRLVGYEAVAGVRVTGRLRITDQGRAAGRLRVDGPRRLDGGLTLARQGRVTGSVGRKQVRVHPRDAGAARAAGGPDRRSAPLPQPMLGWLSAAR